MIELPISLAELTPVVRGIISGFIVAMLLTPVYTYFAYKHQWWKKPRTTAVTGEKLKVFTKLHAKKHARKIPTMAGLVFILSIAIATVLVTGITKEQTLVPLLALLGGGAVGLLDDIINLQGDGSGVAGLRSKIKLLLIIAVAAIGSWYIYFKLGYANIAVPFSVPLELGWILVPIFIFVIIATANAVNITDGLDGLAGGLLAIVFGAYTIIAALQGNIGIAAFSATVVGALLSYTWFNVYPARFFMGDVGSFSLGAALGFVALLTDTMFLLPIIAGVFVIEGGSSLLQIVSKKYFGRKIFRAAPIHHHFEALGWPETKFTMRAWILGTVLAGVGLYLAIAGELV